MGAITQVAATCAEAAPYSRPDPWAHKVGEIEPRADDAHLKTGDIVRCARGHVVADVIQDIGPGTPNWGARIRFRDRSMSAWGAPSINCPWCKASVWDERRSLTPLGCFTMPIGPDARIVAAIKALPVPVERAEITTDLGVTRIDFFTHAEATPCGGFTVPWATGAAS